MGMSQYETECPSQGILTTHQRGRWHLTLMTPYQQPLDTTESRSFQSWRSERHLSAITVQVQLLNYHHGAIPGTDPIPYSDPPHARTFEVDIHQVTHPNEQGRGCKERERSSMSQANEGQRRGWHNRWSVQIRPRYSRV